MGNTKEYLDYLNNEVGIAPAASQEELDLAQSLADTYAKHGLNPEIQEFPAQSWATLPHGIVMVLLFIGAILVGVGPVATLLIGLIFIIGAIALLATAYTGQDVLSKMGPKAHSQNVIAVRRADEGGERNRPIVVMAHYDTPRVDMVANSQFASSKKYFPTIVPNALIAVGVCAFVQILVFLPEAARRTFWVLGIIAALPVLAWGITLIARKFSAYADGAVGNKSSVAALLTVMDYVCSGDSEVERKKVAPEAAAEQAEVVDSLVRPATRTVIHEEVEEIEGKRHGEEVIRKLGILPESCEITYIEPEVHTYETEEPIEYDDEPAAEATGMFVASESADGVDDADEIDPNATRPMPPISLDAQSLAQLEDGQSTDEGPLQETDHSGLSTMVEEDAEVAASTPRSERALPVDVDDPDWGKSSYTPEARSGASNVARRAALFDLPSVASEGNDGFGVDEEPVQGASYGMAPSTPLATSTNAQPSAMAQRLAEASSRIAEAPSPVRLEDASSAQYGSLSRAGAEPQDDIEVLSPTQDASAQAPRRGLAKLFERKRQQQESMSEWLGVDDDFNAKTSGESIGSWDNFDDDEPRRGHWKGGAARSVNLRGNVAAALGSLPQIDTEDPADIPLPTTAEDPTDIPLSNAVQDSTDSAASLSGETVAMQIPQVDKLDETALLQDDAVEDVPVVDEAPEQENPYLQNGSDEGLFIDADAINADEQTDEQSEQYSEGEQEEEPVADELPVVPIDRELRDAILAMGDEELKKHDVWFVLTGASELNHAGVTEFVAEHRKDLRGAFIINLESVGAGELTALTSEGFGRPRRADKRLLRLLSSVASDMHFELPQLKRTWANTEATACMRRSLRAVTLMGMGPGELPAYSATASDSPDVVSEDQILDAVALITEAIRRS